jgi:hypothetical protein
VVWRDLGDRVIAIAPDSPEPITLPLGGAVLWDALEEAGTVEELAAQVGASYDAPSGWAAPAVEHLLAARLVEVEP